MRHDSVVKDFIGGQLRSQLVCPVCKKVSVSFDYFNTLQLAVPLKSEAPVKLLFISQVLKPNDEPIPPIFLTIKIDLNKSCILLKHALAEQLGNMKYFTSKIDPSLLEIFEIDSESKLPSNFIRSTSIISEFAGSMLFAYLNNKEHDRSSMIFNRTITTSMSEDQSLGYDIDLLGYPILLTYSSSWSVSRLRFQIWLQV